MIAATSRFLGRIRGFYIPLGVFAVLAVGMHAGSNRADDHLVVVYNALDAWVDDLLTAVLGWGLRRFGAEPSTVDRATFVVVDFIDLEVKDVLARGTALVAELWADVLLAVPLLLFRRRTVSIKASWAAFRADPNLHWGVAPLAAMAAAVSGSFLIAREVQIAMYAQLTRLPIPSEYIEIGVGVFGALALGLVGLRLGLRAVASTLTWAESRARADRATDKTALRRRLRGIWLALVALPLAMLALVEATPPSKMIAALFGGL